MDGCPACPRLEAIAVGFIRAPSGLSPPGEQNKAHGDGFEPWVGGAFAHPATGIKPTAMASSRGHCESLERGGRPNTMRLLSFLADYWLLAALIAVVLVGVALIGLGRKARIVWPAIAILLIGGHF